ncbi:hypothetical protein Drorol1_Dr00022292 [Drosera rotundifolia]
MAPLLLSYPYQNFQNFISFYFFGLFSSPMANVNSHQCEHHNFGASHSKFYFPRHFQRILDQGGKLLEEALKFGLKHEMKEKASRNQIVLKCGSWHIIIHRCIYCWSRCNFVASSSIRHEVQFNYNMHMALPDGSLCTGCESNEFFNFHCCCGYELGGTVQIMVGKSTSLLLLFLI